MDELRPPVQRPPPARHLDPLGPRDHDEPELDEDLQPPAHDRLRDPEGFAHRLLGELPGLCAEEPPERRVAGVVFLEGFPGQEVGVADDPHELDGREGSHGLIDLVGGMLRVDFVELLLGYRG